MSRMVKRIAIFGMVLAGIFTFLNHIPTEAASPAKCGNGICEQFAGETALNCSDCLETPLIESASFITPQIRPIEPSLGDLWFSTWALDDSLYFSWGDGCGPGFHYQPEYYTDAGIARTPGTLPNLTCEPIPGGCIAARHIPSGVPDEDDKPAALIAIGNRIYWAGYTPFGGDPDYGYIAFSDDLGSTWTEMPGSPWTNYESDDKRSYFRCLMFINMGIGNSLNEDGYVYAFGIGTSWDWDLINEGQVYLTRVPIELIGNYSAYRYYAGGSIEMPIWSFNQDMAMPIIGLTTAALASAIYHEGLDRYLFLNENALFEASRPWGPWTAVAPLFHWSEDVNWQGGYMPSLIPKGIESDSVWFAAAGQDNIVRYSLNIGQIGFQLRRNTQSINPALELMHPPSLPTAISNPSFAHRRPPKGRQTLNVPSDYPDLQSAIEAATDGDAILIEPGNYSGPRNTGITVKNLDNLTIVSETGPDECTINCELNSRSFAFYDCSNLRISGIKIENGYTNGCGGSFLTENCQAIITNCILYNNAAFYQGGAIICSRSRITIDSCVFTENSAGQYGGALDALNSSYVFVQYSSFIGNTARSKGGALYQEISHFVINSSYFENNQANYGGALHALLPCEVICNNSFFIQNHALVRGGAIGYDRIYPTAPGCGAVSFKIQNCTLVANDAVQYGGAISIERAETAIPSIQNSIFWDNASNIGDQIALIGDGSLVMSINIDHCDIEGGLQEIYSGIGWTILGASGIVNSDPIFITGAKGDFYLSQISAGQPIDSPCMDAGSAGAAAICFDLQPSACNVNNVLCLNSMTTRIDGSNDTNLADLGAHYIENAPVYLPIARIPLLIFLVLMMTIILLRYSKSKNRSVQESIKNHPPSGI